MITSAMRGTFKPWVIIDGRELVSYPWPSGGHILINARTVPGDATTMKTFKIVNWELEEIDAIHD